MRTRRRVGRGRYRWIRRQKRRASRRLSRRLSCPMCSEEGEQTRQYSLRLPSQACSRWKWLGPRTIRRVGAKRLAEPHSVGGLHAAAARQLRWLASAEEEAMERETLSEEQSPQKRSSSMATGSAGSSSNGSSLSGSCNGINGSGSSGGGSPKGGGGGGGGVGGIIRQGVAFVRQHSFERKKEKMKAKAAAAAAAATQAQSAAATAYPSMDMKAWEAKRVSGAANGMPAPTPPTPAAGFDREQWGRGNSMEARGTATKVRRCRRHLRRRRAEAAVVRGNRLSFECETNSTPVGNCRNNVSVE